MANHLVLSQKDICIIGTKDLLIKDFPIKMIKFQLQIYYNFSAYPKDMPQNSIKFSF